jgi:branched-chain amino acid aminotransferase
MTYAWLNNTFVEEDSASIALRDTGLLHAAGVFTTMRADKGKVFRLNEHLRRLRQSCEALFIPLAYDDGALKGALAALLQRNQLSDARVRLTVTRGVTQTDPVHGIRLSPTTFMTASKLELYPQEFYDKGLTAILLDEQKLNPYDIQAGHKMLNYFSRLAALHEAGRRGAGEALWFNVHNYLQSGSISNVFIVKDDILVTPPTNAEMRDPAVAEQTAYPTSAVLPGVTRSAVMDVAHREKIGVKLASITVEDLLAADELFVTNSVMRIMPVCRIERKAIGRDKPGEITMKLTNSFQRLTEESGQSA